jgi:hypothetical protein
MASASATSKSIELFTDAPLGVERIIESLQMLARLSREAAAAEAVQVSAAPRHAEIARAETASHSSIHLYLSTFFCLVLYVLWQNARR